MRVSFAESALRCAVFLAVVFTMAACSGRGDPKPGKIQATIAATADVNPNLEGRPSPILLYLFQLKAAGAFEAADFYSLYQTPDSTLGTDLLGKEELLLKPGQVVPLEIQLDPQARYLGFLAAYSDLDHSIWRVGHAAPGPGTTTALSVYVERSALSIAAKD